LIGKLKTFIIRKKKMNLWGVSHGIYKDEGAFASKVLGRKG